MEGKGKEEKGNEEEEKEERIKEGKQTKKGKKNKTERKGRESQSCVRCRKAQCGFIRGKCCRGSPVLSVHNTYSHLSAANARVLSAALLPTATVSMDTDGE